MTDVSGAGNNWAHGYCEYGPQYRDAILDQVRGALEIADSPQAFLLLHSLGGGTGSGLGSYILEALRDDAPELYRLSTAVLPSGADDVITSPYNALLSLWKLTDAADVVVPFENAALMGIVDTVDRAVSGRARLVPASCITFVGPPPAAPHLLDVRPLAPAPRAIKLPPQLAPAPARVERVGITGREVATKSTKVRGADFVAHGSAVRHVSDVASSTVDVRAGLEARHRTVVVRSTAATARGSAVARASLLGDSRVAGSGRGALHVERDLEDDKQDGGIDVMFPREESVRNDGDIKLLSRVTARRGTAWDSVNNIGALAIAHLTASMRFEGPHNVDLNEIATTLVPFPRLHFLTTGLAPLYIKADDAAAAYSGARARRIDALFTDATSRPAQLVQGDPRRVAPLLAAGFLLRGSDVAISDAQRNMRRMRRELPMAAWNPDGASGARFMRRMHPARECHRHHARSSLRRI